MARIETAEYRAALQVTERLRGAGFQAVLAGGCVRDLLLGAEPKDWDVATDARPEEVSPLFGRTEHIGAHFGVTQVIDAGPEGERVQTEVATFRHDVGYSDGRRPSAVQYSRSAEEDVLRRDFTVNGLLMDPARWEAGEPLEACVLDYVGGRADLEARVLRAIGEPERRFGEDKLRLLRAVRFASRFGLQIEAGTMEAIRRQAGTIEVVSAERVAVELTRMLEGGHVRRAFALLDETGLLEHMLPEVAAMKGCAQPPEFHPEGDVWVHTLMLLEHLPKHASRTLGWGMLLHDVGKPPTFTEPDPGRPGDRIRFNGHAHVGAAMTRAILRRLRFSNEDTEQVVGLVANHMRFGDVEEMRASTLKRFLRMPRFEEHLALHFADCMSSHGKLGKYEFAKRHWEELGAEEIRPRLLVTGEDLKAAGYRPGPKFRQMLTVAEDAQLEGAIATAEQGMELVRARFGEPGEGS